MTRPTAAELFGPAGTPRVWANEPRAFLGITVPAFPNFFMLYGPGTNGGGEIVIMLESQAEYAVRAVKRMIRERVTAVDPVASRQRAVPRVDQAAQARFRDHAPTDRSCVQLGGRGVTVIDGMVAPQDSTASTTRKSSATSMSPPFM